MWSWPGASAFMASASRRAAFGEAHVGVSVAAVHPHQVSVPGVPAAEEATVDGGLLRRDVVDPEPFTVPVPEIGQDDEEAVPRGLVQYRIGVLPISLDGMGDIGLGLESDVPVRIAGRDVAVVQDLQEQGVKAFRLAVVHDPPYGVDRQLLKEPGSIPEDKKGPALRVNEISLVVGDRQRKRAPKVRLAARRPDGARHGHGGRRPSDPGEKITSDHNNWFS